MLTIASIFNAIDQWGQHGCLLAKKSVPHLKDTSDISKMAQASRCPRQQKETARPRKAL